MKNLTLTIIITLVAALSASGQMPNSAVDSTTPVGLGVGSSGGNGSDFGSISPFNGSLNYTLPLFEVGGRGQAGYSAGIPINIRWFLSHSVGIEGEPWESAGYYAPEIQSKYMPGILFGRKNSAGSNCGPGEPLAFGSITRLTFASADQSQTDLVSLTKGGGGLPAYCGGSNPFESRGTDFVSEDGSGIKFVSDTEIDDSFGPYTFSVSGYLYFRNGTIYRIDGSRVTWIKDRNGNLTSFTYTGLGWNARLTQITDANGRNITIEYDLTDSTYGLHDRITLPGFGTSTRSIRVGYTPMADSLFSGETIQTYSQLFDAGNMHNPNLNFNPLVVSRVWFPDDRSFSFKYNRYGELARVDTPLGAAYEYDHGASVLGGPTGGIVHTIQHPEISRQVLEKRVYSNGGTGSSYDTKTTVGRPSETFQNPYYKSSRIVTVSDSQNNVYSSSVHYFYGTPLPKDTWGHLLPYFWKDGREYETQIRDSDGTLVGRELREWTVLSGMFADPRPSRRLSVAIEGGNALVSLEETTYDENVTNDHSYFSHLNAKRIKSYHPKIVGLPTAQTGAFESIAWIFGESDLLAVSETDYLYDPTYKARGILGLATETRVLNPTNLNDVFAKSQFVYDESEYFDNNYTTSNWVDPASILRGNVTTGLTWVKNSNTWIEAHTMYDNFGNVRKVWDTSGDTTRFIETEYNATYKYAYPVKTKAPVPDPTGVHGSTEGSEITRIFDFNTGLMTSVTDARNQTATTEYDSLLRPVRVNPPSGGGVSETVYNDVVGDLWIKGRTQIDDVNWAESTVHYDSLGRVKKSRTKDQQGDVVTEVRYDTFGRVEKSSNPYRVDAGGNPIETVYWSKVRYDSRNRAVEGFSPAPDGQNGASLGITEFGISTESGLVGTYTIATDASGRKSRAISGVYGLMRVDEATGIGGTVDQDLGTVSNPNQPTSYSYNVKGELVKITQGKTGQLLQHRCFAYDSLGRLIRVRQPEQTPNTVLATTGNPDNNQWTAGYTYDVFGNVISMTDAKNTTITTDYDKAGRTIKRTYSDGTPQAEFFYDGKGLPSVPAFSRGALTKATNGISEDRFTEFDNHGRLKTSQQLIDGQSYEFLYRYNLSGGLVEQTYPSGRIIRNYLDQDGGLNVVTSKASNGLNKVVASNFDYTAAGGITKMKLGNGLWETSQVNERFQLTQVGLGTTATNNNLFKIDYEYGEISSDHASVDTGKNVGMIARTTTTIPTTSFVQTYKYDAIARITEAKEKTGSTTNWQQTFGYDIFGNRTSLSQSINGSSIPNTNINHPTIDPTNNRFTTGQGYTFDSNGNLIQDAEGRSFTFDGNDKQTIVRDLNIPTTQQNPDANVIGRYYYDASGARIKKVTNSETTVFVYDAAGALAAEYSTQVETANPQESYLTGDHLGSPRVITDKTGNVVSRRDFMPFGEELNSGIGPRTPGLNYATNGSDSVRKRFTGYEKDQETQLDFAEARMYQNKHGRFTAVDSLMASAGPWDPQTLNRYTYTANNPVNRSDPSGLDFCIEGRGGSSGTVIWTGQNKGCKSGDQNVTGQTHEITGSGTINGVNVQKGDHVFFNANGTPEVRQRAVQQPVTESGPAVAGTSANLPRQSAATTAQGAASSGSAPNGGIVSLPTAAGSAQEFNIVPCIGLIEKCTPSTPRLDTSNVGELETVKTIQTLYQLCSFLPGIGGACAVGSAIISVGSGNFGEAGTELLMGIPGLRQAKGLSGIAKAGDDLVESKRVVEGIYEFVSSNGKVYVGQSGNIAARIEQHIASGKMLPGTAFNFTEVLGGKTAREVAEQLRINALGGIGKLRNERNPIGKARKYLLEGL